MFKNSGPSTSLDCSLKNTQSAAASLTVKDCGKSSLSAPLYNSGSKSSCSNSAKGGSGQLVATNETNCAGWQNQVTNFVSQYSVNSAGYGGTVASAGYGGTVASAGYGGEVVVQSSCKHFNQGIGNGTEGGDPGRSQPHGGSNDEGGRTPGQRWIPNIFSGLGR